MSEYTEAFEEANRGLGIAASICGIVILVILFFLLTNSECKDENCEKCEVATKEVFEK